MGIFPVRVRQPRPRSKAAAQSQAASMQTMQLGPGLSSELCSDALLLRPKVSPQLHTVAERLCCPQDYDVDEEDMINQVLQRSIIDQ